MKYYDEMTSKYGFGDGDKLPPDAFTTRAVYVSVINARAKQQGSGYRAYPYNRPGVHNPCMIVFAAAQHWDALTRHQRRDGCDRFPESLGCDEALSKAIEWACEEPLDELIITNCSVDEARLRSLLRQAQG